MSQPLRPKQQIEEWTVQHLLAWGQRGGLYRVQTPGGPAILKELLYPSGLDAVERERRTMVLRKAVESWQQLKHPQAISVQQVHATKDRFYLLLPEIQGSTLSVQVRLRKEPPAAPQTVLWADQMAGMAEALLEHEHPLALEILRSDRVLIHETRLTVFNPGWSELLWRDSQCPIELTEQEGLRLYGQFLVEMATGDCQHSPDAALLPAGLIWVVGRCLSQASGRSYRCFGDVRKALRNLQVQGDEARNMRALGSLPPLFGFTLPRMTEIPRSPAAFLSLLAGLCCLLSGLFWLGWRVAQSPPPWRPGLVLAIGRDLYALSRHEPLRRIWRFGRPVQALAAHLKGSRLYVALQGEPPELEILDTDQQQARTLSLLGPAQSLWACQAPSELALMLSQGRLVRFRLGANQETPLDSTLIGSGCTGLALLSLDRPANPNHAHKHREGVVAAQPQFGLSLFDATSGERIAQWKQPGISALLSTPRVLLAATGDGQLLRFSNGLQLREKISLPLDSGLCHLISGVDSEHFWTLQVDGRGRACAGWWSFRQTRLIQQRTLEAVPQVFSVDDQGNLWWTDPALRLHCLTLHPLEDAVLASLPGAARSMIWLEVDRTPRGLQRLIQ